MGFIADDEIEGRQAVEVLGAAWRMEEKERVDSVIEVLEGAALLKRVRPGCVQLHDLAWEYARAVGGGAAGLELAFAMRHRFRSEIGAEAPHVRVLTDAQNFLPEYSTAVRGRLLH